MQAKEVSVGIADLAIYAPERVLTSAEISKTSGIPEAVLIEKFGLKEKRISGPDEHVTDMCISAARPLVERNGASEIDAVIYFGSHWKEYLVWQAAPKIQYALGIEGFAIETINVSAGAPVALRVAADMLRAESRLRSILIVAASKESHLLDYSDEASRFMFNFGDGAVAALLSRDHDENRVLSTSILTDGSFADHVRVSGGGSVAPASQDTVEQGLHQLGLHDGYEMKRRLDPITLKNFIEVTRECVEESGLSIDDIDLLLPIHFKRSLHEQVLTELGLTGEQSIYLDSFGHMSAVDPLFALTLARDSGKLKDGDNIVLLAAGTGYTWAASVITWGKPA